MVGPSNGGSKPPLKNNGNLCQGSATIVKNSFEILSQEVDLTENDFAIIIGESSLTLEPPLVQPSFFPPSVNIGSSPWQNEDKREEKRVLFDVSVKEVGS
jgi:hypothetical protein